MPDLLIGATSDHAHSGAYALAPLLPTGALGETLSRLNTPVSNLVAKTSGTLALVGLALPAGVLCSSITFLTRTTALAAGTNQWFGIFDSARVPLRLTVDDTNVAWAGNTFKTLALSSTFTTTYSGLHYLGIMVAAGTMPTLAGVAAGTALMSGNVPILNGNSSAGLTNPASCPNPAGAISPSADAPYAYVS
jgi:hypothetical protein